MTLSRKIVSVTLLLIHATYKIRVRIIAILYISHTQAIVDGITFYLHVPIIFTLLVQKSMAAWTVTINIPMKPMDI